MMSRRAFLSRGSALAAGLALGSQMPGGDRRDRPASQRPPPEKRRFTSEAVEATIAEVTAALPNAELAWLFANCFPNTLDTTVEYTERAGQPDTFVITGDIHAMWLRDSTAQVWPYVGLAPRDPKLQRLLAGVIRRQVDCILIDPYANAFNNGPAVSPWANDHTAMKPELHERKWEVDSLCWPIRLAHGYWKATGDTAVFDVHWKAAMAAVLRTFREQQRKTGRGPYSFTRTTDWAPDAVPGGGWGNPIRPNGLIASIFRPSDDATVFPFLIPSNHFAAVALRQLAELADGPAADPALARGARELGGEVEAALQAHGTAVHPRHGRIWAYEVDGFGNALFIDDANLPSLLALPYLGACAAEDPLYAATRRFVLSDENPWHFRGTAAAGVGGPHTGPDSIWPIALVAQAMTSRDDAEIVACLQRVVASNAGTGFMHESFHKDDPARFSRKWFAWANTFFGELVLLLFRTRPDLLRQI